MYLFDRFCIELHRILLIFVGPFVDSQEISKFTTQTFGSGREKLGCHFGVNETSAAPLDDDDDDGDDDEKWLGLA